MQHNDIQHTDIQHNDIKCNDTQQNGTQYCYAESLYAEWQNAECHRPWHSITVTDTVAYSVRMAVSKMKKKVSIIDLFKGDLLSLIFVGLEKCLKLVKNLALRYI